MDTASSSCGRTTSDVIPADGMGAGRIHGKTIMSAETEIRGSSPREERDSVGCFLSKHVSSKSDQVCT